MTMLTAIWVLVGASSFVGLDDRDLLDADPGGRGQLDGCGEPGTEAAGGVGELQRLESAGVATAFDLRTGGNRIRSSRCCLVLSRVDPSW
jgi:hypothetical protein